MTVALGLPCFRGFAFSAQAARTNEEQQLIGVLQSNQSPAGKGCRLRPAQTHRHRPVASRRWRRCSPMSNSPIPPAMRSNQCPRPKPARPYRRAGQDLRADQSRHHQLAWVPARDAGRACPGQVVDGSRRPAWRRRPPLPWARSAAPRPSKPCRPPPPTPPDRSTTRSWTPACAAPITCSQPAANRRRWRSSNICMTRRRRTCVRTAAFRGMIQASGNEALAPDDRRHSRRRTGPARLRRCSWCAR